MPDPTSIRRPGVAAKKSLYGDFLKMVGNSDADAERMMQIEQWFLRRAQDRRQDTEPGGAPRPDEDDPHHDVGAVAERLQGH